MNMHDISVFSKTCFHWRLSTTVPILPHGERGCRMAERIPKWCGRMWGAPKISSAILALGNACIGKCRTLPFPVARGDHRKSLITLAPSAIAHARSANTQPGHDRPEAMAAPRLPGRQAQSGRPAAAAAPARHATRPPYPRRSLQDPATILWHSRRKCSSNPAG